jgi:hypothetical protein
MALLPIFPYKGVHPIRDGFTYEINNDVYLCSQGKQLRKDGIRLKKALVTTTISANKANAKAVL